MKQFLFRINISVLVLAGIAGLSLIQGNLITDIVQKSEQSGDNAKARALAEKFKQNLAETTALTIQFTQLYYWYFENEWRSQLPLNLLRHEEICNITMAQTPNAYKTHVSVKGKVVLTHVLKDGELTEYKAPYSGVEGQVTHYPIDGRIMRLSSGVDGHVCCYAGIFACPWIGAEKAFRERHPSYLDRAMRPAESFGDLIVNGEWFEDGYVLLKRGTHWDAFFFDENGWLIKDVIFDFDHEPGKHNRVDVRVNTFHYERTADTKLPGEFLEHTSIWTPREGDL